MKKNIASIIFLTMFAINCFADTHNVVNSVFSINLPANMKLAWQHQDKEKNFYQFVFQAPPFGDYSSQQIRVTAVGQAPNDTTEYNEWETNALGANIAMFTEAYHLDLSKRVDVLTKKPEKIKLGKQIFTAFPISFNNMETYFLITTTKSSTYNIILVSIHKDLKTRKLNMQKLINAVKSIEFFGAKKSL